MEPNWTQNGIKNRSQLQHANFQKSLKNQRKINTFGVPRGRSWDRKSTKNRSEKEVPKGARLGIDFGWIWDGFGVQVEPQNRAKLGRSWSWGRFWGPRGASRGFSNRLGGQFGRKKKPGRKKKGVLQGDKNVWWKNDTFQEKFYDGFAECAGRIGGVGGGQETLRRGNFKKKVEDLSL